jgi:hypothetical protein
MINATPTTVSPRATQEERQLALTQIYYQVLERQPYEFERKKLAKLEKDFLRDKIGVRRFLKEFGCSDIYLESFYSPSSNVKFLEVCFKHFLGRAIASHEEMRHYDRILTTLGVAKAIHAMLDSEEYRKNFGCFTVPYQRQPERYESPKAYLESRLLNEEHIGQRGRTMPTLYWHELGYTCENGTCHHPEAHEVLDPMVAASDPAPDVAPELSVDELLSVLRTASPTQARDMVASLSPQQRHVLRQAIH